jgi:nucleoside triphosphate pyrophosphatase
MLVAAETGRQTDGMSQLALLLASASPRRRDLLQQLGFQFETSSTDIDERWAGTESPLQHAARLAREKARAAAESCPPDGPWIILAADTVVAVDGEVLGKPSGRPDALRMLARLSGAEHSVVTAVAVISAGDLIETSSTTRVWFRDLSEEECIDYWQSGEPADKAGAYAIQGLAAAFVRRIDGSYSGVVGLPLHETAALLARVGLRLPLEAARNPCTEQG